MSKKLAWAKPIWWHDGDHWVIKRFYPLEVHLYECYKTLGAWNVLFHLYADNEEAAWTVEKEIRAKTAESAKIKVERLCLTAYRPLLRRAHKIEKKDGELRAAILVNKVCRKKLKTSRTTGDEV